MSEARKNPEVNFTVAAYDVLKKFKGQKDIFVSFQSVARIGINPASAFKTPTGIYTYPIDYALKHFTASGKFAQFGGDRPFIFILKRTTSAFIEDISKLSQSEWSKNLKFLRAYVAKNLKGPNKADNVNLKKEIKALQADWKGLDKWEKAQSASSLRTDFTQKDFDDNKVLKPVQVWSQEFGNPDIYETKQYSLDAVKKNINIQIEKRTALIAYNEDPIQGLLVKIGTTTDTLGEKLWSLTRLIANDGNAYQFAYNLPPKWTALWRKMGYKGVADMSGAGIIHPAEKTQAVFFERSAFKVIDMIDNIAPQKKPSKDLILLMKAVQSWFNIQPVLRATRPDYKDVKKVRAEIIKLSKKVGITPAQALQWTYPTPIKLKWSESEQDYDNSGWKD
jgi:hypothetical protein